MRSDEGGSASISSYNDVQQHKKRAQDDPKFADAGKVELSGQNDMASKWPQKLLALIMSRKWIQKINQLMPLYLAWISSTGTCSHARSNEDEWIYYIENEYIMPATKSESIDHT